MSSPRDSRVPSVDALANLVLRCRQLATQAETLRAEAPTRNEAPFLYGQLDAELENLEGRLRALGTGDGPAAAERKGFWRRLRENLGRKRGPDDTDFSVREGLSGNTWTVPVSDLIGFLSGGRKTGVLWIMGAEENFLLELCEGELVHATSDCTPVGLRLGEVLVAQLALGEFELKALLKDARKEGRALGTHLREIGRITEAELRSALTQQVQHLFQRLMSVEFAIFRFQEGVQFMTSQDINLNITQLLLEAARVQDERQQRESEEQARAAPAEAALLDVLDAALPARGGEEAARDAGDGVDATGEAPQEGDGASRGDEAEAEGASEDTARERAGDSTSLR